MGHAWPLRMDGARCSRQPGHRFARRSRLAEPRAAGPCRGRQRRRRSGAGPRRRSARALALAGGMADGHHGGRWRLQSLPGSVAARCGSLGVTRRRATARRRSQRVGAPRLRRRQRRHGGHDRRARRRRRVSRRPNPSGNRPDAPCARRQHRRTAHAPRQLSRLSNDYGRCALLGCRAGGLRRDRADAQPRAWPRSRGYVLPRGWQRT